MSSPPSSSPQGSPLAQPLSAIDLGSDESDHGGDDESHDDDEDDSQAHSTAPAQSASGLNPFVALHSKFPEEPSRILFLLSLFSALVGFGFFLAYVIQTHWMRADEHPKTLLSFAMQESLPAIEGALIGFNTLFFGSSLAPGSGGNPQAAVASLFRRVVPRFRTWSAGQEHVVTYNSCQSLLFFNDLSLCGKYNHSSAGAGDQPRVELPAFRSPHDVLELEIFSFLNVSALALSASSGGRAFVPFPTPAVTLSILEPGLGRAIVEASPVSYLGSPAGAIAAGESVERLLPAPALLPLNSFYTATVAMEMLTTLSDKHVWSQSMAASPSGVALSAAQLDAAFDRLVESYADDPTTQQYLQSLKAASTSPSPAVHFYAASIHLRPSSFRVPLWLEVRSYSMFDFLSAVGGMLACILVGFGLLFPFATQKPPTAREKQQQQAAAAARAKQQQQIAAASSLSSPIGAAGSASDASLQTAADLQQLLRAPRPRRFFALELWLRYQLGKQQAQADAAAAIAAPANGSSSSSFDLQSPRVRRRAGAERGGRGGGSSSARKYSASSGNAADYGYDDDNDEHDDRERGLRARSNSVPRGGGAAAEESQRQPSATPIRNALADKEAMSPSSPLGSRSTDQEMQSLKQPMLMGSP